VLIDGVVTQQQMLPGADAAHSTLSITGEDLSRGDAADRLQRFPFPATPAEGRVGLMLLKYAWLGIVPMVIRRDDRRADRRTRFRRSRHRFRLHQRARRQGRLRIYLEPQSTPGMSIGYWGADQGRVPQPALNINMDAHSNCEGCPSPSTTSCSCRRSTSTTSSRRSDSHSDPNITPLSPPLGVVEPIGQAETNRRRLEYSIPRR
jgi:hypothetical protein